MFVYLVFFTKRSVWVQPNVDSVEVSVERRITTQADLSLLSDALRKQKPKLQFMISGVHFLREE
jgi:hypothetical protein